MGLKLKDKHDQRFKDIQELKDDTKGRQSVHEQILAVLISIDEHLENIEAKP